MKPHRDCIARSAERMTGRTARAIVATALTFLERARRQRDRAALRTPSHTQYSTRR
jgi:hypothetical protein